MTRWLLPTLLVLSGCAWFGDPKSAADDALAGSSTPPSTIAAPIVGGVLVSPGAGGKERAVALARQLCQQDQLDAEIENTVTKDWQTTLQYRCQPGHLASRAPDAI